MSRLVWGPARYGPLKLCLGLIVAFALLRYTSLESDAARTRKLVERRQDRQRALRAFSLRRDRVTVVVTAFQTESPRPAWLANTCARLVSQDFRDVIEAVIVVWNNPSEELPVALPPTVTVLRATRSSLSNKFVH